ncbi:hypothetical protein ACFWPA_08540 [Rhodococcus sp. NPDC058505]|uniref:hypothetical protein n=1 Tax=unclassified Rhodococcus (in: high G+C Gram-positive bacteria) TaxID=192944 RepID=UPI00365ACC02
MIVELKPAGERVPNTVGAPYPTLLEGRSDVLEIAISHRSDTTYRVIDKSGLASIWPAGMFDVVDNTVPDGWILIPGRGGGLMITHGRFARAGFWEDYFDGHPDAVEEFADVVSELGGGRYPVNR